MQLIYNKIFLEHKNMNHPECPERLLSFGKLKDNEIKNGEKYLKLVYDDYYAHLVKDASSRQMSLDVDTYTNTKSYEVACHAVGAAVMAAKQNDFALVRPPGHHATRKKSMGFCIFNNIAVACKWLNERSKKVFLLDIDSHSGNGSQEIFYDTDEVLFMSIHQFPAYPGTGWVNEIGVDKGKYFTVNLPLPPYSGDDIFINVLSKLLPVVKDSYNPDIVAVSAGFDGHKDDPLLELNLTSNSYYEVGKLLSSNFDRVFACLEGGYNTKVLSLCINSFLRGINYEKSEDERNKSKDIPETKTNSSVNIQREFDKRMKKLRLELDGYWKF